ncbi:hypothetical protein [Reticulibacter mediterranei]|uniref:hypothetical protein n=1 Tax=Reticulibacter mediterranei TaxID=2778369 RepID=UPI001C693280|nr:hypothetical protein [Reticulibacter mediterranei]
MEFGQNTETLASDPLASTSDKNLPRLYRRKRGAGVHLARVKKLLPREKNTFHGYVIQRITLHLMDTMYQLPHRLNSMTNIWFMD